MPCQPKRLRRPRKLKGLGDAVALIAQPIARGIDHVFHTDIQHCQGCGNRQAFLNRLLPNPSAPLPGGTDEKREVPE